MFAVLSTTNWVSLIVAVIGAVALCIPVSLSYRRSGDARDEARKTSKQMENNGGSSLRDAIDRIELNQFRFEEKWDRRFANLEHRTARIESAIKEQQS